MPPRYFIGVGLPKSIANQITNTQIELFDNQSVLRPLTPHITIIHPNALSQVSPMWLLPKIKQLQDVFLPTSIKLGAIELFNDSVLHFKVNSPNLILLQEQIVELLPPDVKSRYYLDKKFVPHITIAQTKPHNKLSQIQINTYTAKLEGLIGYSFDAKFINKYEHTAPRQYQIQKI